MKILIIGGTGLVSGAMVEQFVADGHQVSTYTRGKAHQRFLDGEPQVEKIHGDRNDHAAFVVQMKQRRFDAVIDTICYQPADARADVVAFGGRVGQLVLISSDFVYGTHAMHLPMSEDFPTRPISEYGRNKLAAEQELRQAHERKKLSSTIVRSPHIYGPGAPLGISSICGRSYEIVDQIRGEHPIVLLDDGVWCTQPIYSSDVAKGVAAILNTPKTAGATYHLVGPRVYRAYEYYDAIGRAVGAAPRFLSVPSSVYLRYLPKLAPFCFHRIYDCSKLAAEAGFRATVEIDSAVSGVLEWQQRAGLAQPYSPDKQQIALIAMLEYHLEQLTVLLRKP